MLSIRSLLQSRNNVGSSMHVVWHSVLIWMLRVDVRSPALQIRDLRLSKAFFNNPKHHITFIIAQRCSPWRSSSITYNSVALGGVHLNSSPDGCWILLGLFAGCSMCRGRRCTLTGESRDIGFRAAAVVGLTLGQLFPSAGYTGRVKFSVSPKSARSLL